MCRAMADKYSPRQKHAVDSRLRLSGLEPLQYEPDPELHRRTFINIGERCNVAGSSIYKKAIVDGDFDKALAIAVKQVLRAAWDTPCTACTVICSSWRGHPGCLHGLAQGPSQGPSREACQVLSSRACCALCTSHVIPKVDTYGLSVLLRQPPTGPVWTCS